MNDKTENTQSRQDESSGVSDTQIRKRESRKHKKDVGMITITIDLDPDTSELLDQLCHSQGYDLGQKCKRNINRARVITYCIRKACNKEGVDLEVNPTNQAIRITSNIVQRLKITKKPSTDINYTDKEIVELMSDSRFLRPGALIGNVTGSTSKDWTLKGVDVISNEEKVLKKMGEILIKSHRESAHNSDISLPSNMEIPYVRRTSPPHIHTEAILKVYQIARYRREVCGDSDQQIATFMSNEGYPIPEDMVTSCSPIPRKGWELEDVEQIFNIDEQLDRVDS